MPAVGNKTCICGKTVQAKGYLRHLGRCDKVKAEQSRTQGTIFAARVEDVDAIEDADDMDDEDMDDENMDEDGLLAKRARPAAQPIGGLGAIVPGACTTPAHSCTPLSAAGGFGGQGGASGALSTTRSYVLHEIFAKLADLDEWPLRNRDLLPRPTATRYLVHLRRRGADSRLRISEDGLALALTGSTPSVVGQTSDGRTLLSRSVMLPRKVIHPDEITSCVNELGQITISVPASALEPSVPNPAPTPAQAQAKPGWSRSPSGKPLGKSFSRISASAVNAKKVAPVAKTAAEPAQKSAPDGLRSDQMSSDQKIGESDDGLVDLTDAFAVEEEKQSWDEYAELGVEEMVMTLPTLPLRVHRGETAFAVNLNGLSDKNLKIDLHGKTLHTSGQFVDGNLKRSGKTLLLNCTIKFPRTVILTSGVLVPYSAFAPDDKPRSLAISVRRVAPQQVAEAEANEMAFQVDGI
ncbi:hypothetical protein T492DRAFT_875382 [Pavlovales sp. CCMP2436]|nr:hypothetical protein T492DRAFT_875382 [Pavlovales sp. CCMP2436]